MNSNSRANRCGPLHGVQGRALLYALRNLGVTKVAISDALNIQHQSSVREDSRVLSRFSGITLNVFRINGKTVLDYIRINLGRNADFIHLRPLVVDGDVQLKEIPVFHGDPSKGESLDEGWVGSWEKECLTR